PALYAVSLHDALPIWGGSRLGIAASVTLAATAIQAGPPPRLRVQTRTPRQTVRPTVRLQRPSVRDGLTRDLWSRFSTACGRFVRSEEHTSELQSPDHL